MEGAMNPPIPARPDIFESAEALVCFHGRLTNTEEDKIFKNHLDTRGAFLLRKSNSQPDILVLSIVVDRKNIYHIKLQQLQGRVCIVQSQEEFLTLTALIKYFSQHPFPAVKHRELYLTQAIPVGKRVSAGGGSIDERPPMPLPPGGPKEDPIYAEYRHLYSRVDKVEPDQLGLILSLCREVDLEIQTMSRMKCSCGLYMEESQLIDGWMMHRDTEGDSTKGRVFFLDTNTNRSTWRLPQDLEQELKTSHPEKWRLVCRLTREPAAN